MKKTSIFALTAMAVMLISVFAPVAFATGPTQPPVDTTTLYVGTISWGPARADPVRAYDTASGELIFNVYDTLISMGEPVDNQWGTPQVGGPWDVQEQYWAFSPSLATNVPIRDTISKTVTNTTNVDLADPATSGWTGPSTIIDWVDNKPDGVLGVQDVVYMIEPDGSYRTWIVTALTSGATVSMTLERYSYTFHIRTSPVINFYDNNGLFVSTFNVTDTQYSFQRGIVQDMSGSPMWMYYKPLFDQMDSRGWTNSTYLKPIDFAHLIDNAIEVSGNDLIINLGIPFPDVAFKQIIAQTWGSIMSKTWCVITKGLWNGNLYFDGNANGYPDWYEAFPVGWRRLPTASDPIVPIVPGNYAGTGPYRVVVANQPGNLVVLQRNANYWQGWPAPNRKAYLEYIDIEYITSWETRREAFKAGQLDVNAVPRAFMLELLDPADPARMTTTVPGIKTIKNISPQLTEDNIFFTFTVDPTSTALYTGSFPGGIPFDFFNNIHTRRAFAYAFNHTKYLNEVWLGEAIARQTPDIFGLVPDYYSLADKNGLGPWTYDKNLAQMEAELKLAMFTQLNTTSGNIETHSVWDWGGFHLDMYYNSGNDPRRLACEFVQASFVELNNLNPDKHFLIDIQAPDWATYLTLMEEYRMPIFVTGWQADFADADNLKRSFMHSSGYFARIQNYTVENGWTTSGFYTGMNKDVLIDLALKTPDTSANRALYYSELDDIYIADDPSLPIAQPIGRKWLKYWVKGWYYNALYGASVSPFLSTCDYFYKMYKENSCWADVIGPPYPPQFIPYPDGHCNLRDIGYIANHFGAKAPDPQRDPPYDPKWAPGTYGCYGCDVYGDRKVDMRDIGFACAHFCHTTEP